MFASKSLNVNRYAVIEYGLFAFGLDLCLKIHKFYSAISYHERGVEHLLQNLSLTECVNQAMPLVTLLSEMQTSREDTHHINCFQGDFGMPYSKTFKCFSHTVNGCKAL